MEHEVFNDYEVESGTQDDIMDFASKSITSPRLEREAANLSESTNNPEQGSELDAKSKMFSFKPKKVSGGQVDDFIENLDEDKINDELEAIDEEDYQLAADLLITFIDWAFEKVLNWVFKKKTVTETPKQLDSLKHMKVLMKKVIMKWGVKFKIEFLLVLLMIMYFYARFQDAESIDSSTKKIDKRTANKITILENDKPAAKTKTMTLLKPSKKTEVKSAADILDDKEVKTAEEQEEQEDEEVQTRTEID